MIMIKNTINLLLSKTLQNKSKPYYKLSHNTTTDLNNNRSNIENINIQSSYTNFQSQIT